MKNIILNYHDFEGLTTTFEKSKYTISFEFFKLQLDLLQQFQNIPLQATLNPDFINPYTYSLTFDDGCKSNLYIADELASRNLKGTFYIITDKINHKNFLSKDEIQLISSRGMEIGSHSCTHRHLNRLSYSELNKELRESKLIIEDITGKPVESIAFPGGMGGKREVICSLKKGYKICGLTTPGINEIPLQKAAVNRINIKDNISLKQFERLVKSNKIDLFKLQVRHNILAFPKFIDSVLRQ